MRIYKVIFIFIISLIFFSSCSLISKKYQKTISYEYILDVKNKNCLLIDNIEGNFRIHQTNDSIVKINFKTTLHLKGNELGKEIVPIKFKIDTIENKLVLKVVEKINESRFLKFGKELKEVYELFIPRNLNVEINSNFSDVMINGMNNDFKINLVNGNIFIKNPKGSYIVDIVNGKLKVDADSLKNLTANITNGKFYLYNAQKYQGSFNLNVENGKTISKGINFENIIKSDKKTLIATRGVSENKLEVNVVNGRIYLKENSKTEEEISDK